ncbi:hypothetical protein G4B88_026728, partial [Cannabis sativa]
FWWKWGNNVLLNVFYNGGVVGIVSKFAGGNHIRAWRNDSLAAAGASSLIAWALTALAFGLACKQINVGGHRGWRLRVLEAFIIILAFTELLYVLLLHAGVFSSKYGPGYRDTDYASGSPELLPTPASRPVLLIMFQLLLHLGFKVSI